MSNENDIVYLHQKSKNRTMAKYGLFEKESADVMFGEFATKKAADAEMARYEQSDKEHNCYTEGYYEVRKLTA